VDPKLRTRNSKLKVHIIGVGSPFGDDRLGWEAAEALKHSSVLSELPPGSVTISTCDRPGPSLLQEWDGAERVILIDAVHSGATPGTLHRRQAEELTSSDTSLSSHDMGVAAAVALARSLDQIPARLVLFGIEMDETQQGDDLSRAACSALPALVRAVEDEVTGLLT